MHKAHRIIRRIKMKQNSDNIPGTLTGQVKLPRITVHTREFNLSHMPNPLDTNRIKQKMCTYIIRCVAM